MDDRASGASISMPVDIALELRVNGVINAGTRMPRWGWPVPGPYNGASGLERIGGWQRLNVAERLRWLVRPAFCSICESGQRLHLHTENYFRPLHVHAVCQHCHFCLHRRFKHPGRWAALIACAPASAAWANRIGLTELTREAAIKLARQPEPWP